MASGRGTTEYKTLLVNSDTLADVLDDDAVAKTKLLRKMRANEWIEPTADLSTDDLVALALNKVETEGGQVFDQFVEFLRNITGLSHIAGKMKEMAGPSSPPQAAAVVVADAAQSTADDDPLDLATLKVEVLPVAARWKGFGLSMGLRSDTLDRIEGDYRKVDDCLQALLNEWLKQENTLRGPPSWQLLVDAVASPAGGNNQALAQQIARRHNAKFPARK